MDKEYINSEQLEISKKAPQLAPYQYKKGQSGNPSGRPAGKSLKQYTIEKLNSMTDEEREEFLEGIDKKLIWEMAEGKAESKTDITSKGESIVILPSELINKNDTA